MNLFSYDDKVSDGRVDRDKPYTLWLVLVMYVIADDRTWIAVFEFQ